jgi:hypothetical protein
MAPFAKFQDEDGIVWSRRIKSASKKQKTALTDAEKLRKLYVATHQSRRKWGVSVPIARTLVDGIVCDSYVQNPDPMIEFLSPVDDPDMSSRIRGLTKTLHEEVRTQQIIQRGMVVGSFAGFAIHWTAFEQEHEQVDVKVDNGVELTTVKQLAVKSQRFIGQLVMPSDFRRDPDGVSWDFTDHKWLARMYTLSLQSIRDDNTGAYSEGGKRKLRQWLADRNRPLREDSQRRDSEADHPLEDDDAFKPVNVWEIWSRVDYKIYHLPVGAEFLLGKYEWPKTWKDADEYPATMIAFESDWQPPDEDGEGGWYPLPSLRLVQSPLENLPRLEAAFLDSLTNSAKKLVGIDGLFGPKELTALQSDENRAYIPIDLQALAKKIAGGGQIDLTQFDLRRFVQMLELNDSGSEAAKHLEGIRHQLELCYMLLGQGPGDRAGIPVTKSATESMGIQERLSDRREKRVEEAASIADKITRKLWIVLRGQATLPIRYRHTSEINESTWAFITDPTRELLGMEVLFSHHVGSSRPPSRDVVKAERKELFSLVAPLLQATGDVNGIQEWTWWLANAYDNQFASRLLDTGQKKLAQEIVLRLDQMRNGQRPIDRKSSNELLSLVAMFFQKYLSPQAMQEVAQKNVQAVAPDTTMPAARGMGSMAAAPSSAGQIAAAEAASGAVGGAA